jgi:hypothetical protein
MYCTFISAEPPKKKSTARKTRHCMIGASDDHNLEENQHKKGNKVSDRDPFDSITREPLEVKHVQYVAPDHNLKCCYNASTLDRCRSPQGYLLQPPHFRIPMNSTDAKKVEDSFVIPYQKVSDESFGSDHVQRRVSSNTRLRSWATADMSSSQLWLCPICWTRLTCSPQARTSEEITQKRTTTDPIQRCTDYIIARSVLGGSGLDELAATLSTSKTALKHHLRHDHGIERAPSELLDAYNLRSDDGILHRYLLRRGYHNESAHGALLSYWRHNLAMFSEHGVGFNKFIYLYLHYYAPRITSGSLPDVSEEFGRQTIDALSKPYSNKATESDDEFLDDEEYGSGGMPRSGPTEKDISDIAYARQKVHTYKEEASDYLDHDALEALIVEEAKQMGSESDSSESESESDRYVREKREKEARHKKQKAKLKGRYIDSSESDSEDDEIVTSRRLHKNTILDDDSEED